MFQTENLDIFIICSQSTSNLAYSLFNDYQKKKALKCEPIKKILPISLEYFV